MYLLAAMAILGAAWLGIKYMAKANPASIKTNTRKAGGIAAVILGIILTLKGALPIAIPIFLFGLGLLGLGHLAGIELPWAKNKSGERSHIQTKVLVVDLEHDSGRMHGKILMGSFAGKTLEQLDQSQLLELMDECLAAGDQSPHLLQAYLDTIHPEWRQSYTGQGAKANSGIEGMDEAEALAILGIKAGAKESQIISAHRNLMKQYHPDHGGSDYLAAKINEAKEVLIK